MTTVLILLGIGLAAGILSGFVGIGGGVLIVPALVYLLGTPQHEAQGTSLAILLLPVGILAVINYYQKGFVDIKSAAIIAVAFVAGAFVGSKIAVGLPEATLKKIFGIILAAIAAKMIFGK